MANIYETTDPQLTDKTALANSESSNKNTTKAPTNQPTNQPTNRK